MASMISSSDQRLSTSKRRLKPLMLRDYLLDDLSSCSSNGFKSFPRRQAPSSSSSSSTVRRLLDAEIKRSGLIHHHHRRKQTRLTRRSSRTTCGTAISHAVHKASTAFLNAVRLLPFPSSKGDNNSNCNNNNNNNKPVVFSRSLSKRLLSKSFWRKPLGHSRRVVTGDGDGEIQWWRSVAFEESLLDQPFDLISLQLSTATVVEEPTFTISSAANTTVEEFVSGDSSSSGSEFFTNSSSEDVVQSSSSSFSTSSSGESEEVSNENEAVEDGNERGESLNPRDCDDSSVNRNNNSLCNRQECVNEEKEQLSPVSILECPFKDDEDDDDDDNEVDEITEQNDTYEKIARKSRRLNGLVRLEPLDLEKRIEDYVERQEEYSFHPLETEEDESEERANRLFALVKERIGETNDLLASHAADNLLLDYLQEDDIGPKEETLMVKNVEDWVMGRQEEMFVSWQVKEKREVYVKEMKWGCISGDEKQSVVEDLASGFFTSLVDEFIFDLDS
ncbi:hypothetical protein CARUB_v10003316mg [Capsella rubella]|uniref:DUF4378 domain-containing protein n=1 Tax=Capsella rubella TaxID=81985 RepID=R0GS03_9BRAS|nr:uncharacterized protein LOC17883720 [Capsella rubella]EOA19664.1 hypothetical protein CARUB_v10003316mg [Capsella rubella]